MQFLWLIIPAAAAPYLLSLRGRRKHPGMAELKKWQYAHRGLHDGQRPENSMAAFRAALEAGFGIELDIHLLKDGSLAVLHDSDLKRVTGRDGILEDLTAQDLKDYRLMGTDQTIPEFREVLALFSGKAPLIIELKTHKGNHAALAQAACRMMEGYTGPWCMESFDPFCIRWLKVHHPEIIRGQLSENSLRSTQAYPLVLRFVCTNLLENFLTLPDFIAYRFQDRRRLSVTLCRKLWGIAGVSWTLGTREQYDAAVSEDWIPIFENFLPESKNRP